VWYFSNFLEWLSGQDRLAGSYVVRLAALVAGCCRGWRDRCFHLLLLAALRDGVGDGQHLRPRGGWADPQLGIDLILRHVLDGRQGDILSPRRGTGASTAKLMISPGRFLPTRAFSLLSLIEFDGL